MTEKNLDVLKKFVSWETNDDERPSDEDINDCIINIFEEIGFKTKPIDYSFKRMKELMFRIYNFGRKDAYQAGYDDGYKDCLLD